MSSSALVAGLSTRAVHVPMPPFCNAKRVQALSVCASMVVLDSDVDGASGCMRKRKRGEVRGLAGLLVVVVVVLLLLFGGREGGGRFVYEMML